MRIFDINTAAHTDGELDDYTLRSHVRAVACPDGASLVDSDGKTLTATDRPCYVTVAADGSYDLVPAVVFDTVYSEDDGTTPATPDGPADPHGLADVLAAIDTELETLRADLDALAAQKSAAPEATGTATPSVAGLSDPTGQAPGSPAAPVKPGQ